MIQLIVDLAIRLDSYNNALRPTSDRIKDM